MSDLETKCEMITSKCGNHTKEILRFIVKEVCTACSSTSDKISPSTKIHKYLNNDTSETEVHIHVHKRK